MGSVDGKSLEENSGVMGDAGSTNLTGLVLKAPRAMRPPRGVVPGHAGGRSASESGGFRLN